jgi:hypothetical protein
MILLAASQGSAFAQKKYDTGATDTEIKIGNIIQIGRKHVALLSIIAARAAPA